MAETARPPEEFHDFRLQYLIHVKRQPGERSEPAASYDLTFVHEGEFTYSADGEELVIRPGEAYFCPKGCMRQRKACTAPVLYTSLNFTFAGGDRILLPARHIRHAHSADTKLYLRRLLSVYETKGPFWKEYSNALTGMLFCELLRCNPPEAGVTESPYVKQMKLLITGDLSRRITVEEIADAVHLYPTYCSELFLRETGMSISEFSMRERTEAAKVLLCDPSLSIREVSERTGFCDRFYFSRVFRAQTGMTPTVYRRSVKDTPPLPVHKIETKPTKLPQTK